MDARGRADSEVGGRRGVLDIQFHRESDLAESVEAAAHHQRLWDIHRDRIVAAFRVDGEIAVAVRPRRGHLVGAVQPMNAAR